MLKLISRLYLWLIGWKVAGKKPDIKKFVLIAAPHTSNLDFPITIAILSVMDVKMRYLAKKELFRFPLGMIMRFFGGIPVDRSKKTNMVDHSVELLKTSEELGLMIPVEGTRGYVKDWKTGFYYTALGAGVPLVLGFLDYGKKQGGLHDVPFYPTGNYAEDVKILRAFYKDMTPKHPELSSLNES